MPDDRTPLRGDEAQLFAAYNDVLVRQLRRQVRTTPQIIEDACSIAWSRFLRDQPSREQNWRGWLFRTAQREAWRLDRERARNTSIHLDAAQATRRERQLADPSDEHRRRDDFEAVVQAFETLPPRLRQIAFLRALGADYSELQALLGVSHTRIAHLIRRANDRMRDAVARQEFLPEPLPPRAQRLHDLETAPPLWLTSAIGRPDSSRGGRQGYATRLLAWRRAALAIDDYRALTGFAAEDAALGTRPSGERSARAYDAALRAIDALHQRRDASRSAGR
jgi:RNA polymerase sigma factor (sigma-70 family)